MPALAFSPYRDLSLSVGQVRLRLVKRFSHISHHRADHVLRPMR
jgi:hypothetical protein